MRRIIKRAFVAGFCILCFCVSAHAQYGWPLPFYFSSKPPATVTYVGAAGVTSTVSTYTFSSQSIGTAASNRVVVVCPAIQSNGGSITSFGVTIGGTSATAIGSIEVSSNEDAATQCFYLSVATGTSATIVVTVNTNGDAARIEVYNVFTTTPAPFASNGNNAAAGGTISTTLNIPANGVAIGAYSYVSSSGSPPATTWTGLTLQGTDQNSSGNSYTVSAATGSFASAQSSLSISGNNADSEIASTISVVSWGP